VVAEAVRAGRDRLADQERIERIFMTVFLLSAESVSRRPGYVNRLGHWLG
jgi:hypothetical protein